MLKVLLADDEPFIALGLKKLIPWEDEGFEVVNISENGKQALEYIEKSHVDVVITDIKMPEMTGLELLETVSAKYLSIKFIVVSGYSDFEYVQTALRNHCMDYILKPIQKDELLSILRKIRDEKMAKRNIDVSVICAKSIDSLVDAISINDKKKIADSVNMLFDEIGGVNFYENSISLNMNYLLYKLVYLALEQDDAVSQEDVMGYINGSAVEESLTEGSRARFIRFADDYSEYIIQLRSNASRGVLAEIEREVKENYAENLTLRELSQKYYVNTSYLGQLFKKQYGISFKDYLCEYRIDKAAHALITTDKKIAVIAEEVGYKDLDYFTSKFIEKKGIAPAKYRKNMQSGN